MQNMTEIHNNEAQANGKQPFKPEEHLMQIKSKEGAKDYLPVQWRLVWFRSQCPHGAIKTELLHLDLDRDTEEEVNVWNNELRRSEKVTKHGKGFAVFHAEVSDGVGGVGSGTKSEKAASFDDFIEKAETGAIGRALASLGYGTQFTDDYEDRTTQETKKQRPGMASPSQIASARNLAKLLGKESTVTEDTSEADAKKIVEQLAKEVNAQKQAAKQQ
jgi:hypothetical protein